MAKRTSRSWRSGGTADSIRADLAKGRIAPLYLLLGQDEVEKDSILKAILDAAVDGPSRAFNLDILHGDDADISEVVNRASSFPMMAKRRVLVLKRVDKLLEAASRELLPLIQQPMDTTVLIFTAEKVDGRKKLFQDLRKAGVVADFKIPYDKEVPAWIQRRVGELGKQMAPEAVHLLHMAVGPNPSDLRNELEKLVIHTQAREEITRDDVAWVVSASRENTVFELTDAVGQRHTGDALQILDHLVAQGDNPVALRVMMLRHIGILRKALWLQQARLSQSDMASRLKVPPFFVKNYVQQARAFDDASFQTAFEVLSEADSQLKSRPRSQYLLILTRAIVSICSKPLPQNALRRHERLLRQGAAS